MSGFARSIRVQANTIWKPWLL